MNILRILLLLAISTYMVSCGTQKKATTAYYLNQVNDSSLKADVLMPELRIQKKRYALHPGV